MGFAKITPPSGPKLNLVNILKIPTQIRAWGEVYGSLWMLHIGA